MIVSLGLSYLLVNLDAKFQLYEILTVFSFTGNLYFNLFIVVLLIEISINH